MSEADTICAIATGLGDAAIGIVRLSGPEAGALLRAVCGGRRLAPRRLSLAPIRDPRTGLLLDQALVTFLPGPRSYSGEDMAEVQAHGGRLNLQRLLQLFLDLGARLATPGEFSRRAFLNGRLDLSQVEAVAAVIGARSECALRNAQALLAGGLREKLAPLRQQALELTAAVEANIDFVEELEATPERQALARRAGRLAAELANLAGSYATGRRLQGARVGLVGAVNAGKSTLFNRLLGRARALVSDEPGTTRDYLEAEVCWDGRRLQLVDCAGWRPLALQSQLERAGAALAEQVLQHCDLLLEIVDLTASTAEPCPWSTLQDVPWLRVGNKIDLLEEPRRHEVRTGGALEVVSALSGEGVSSLREVILEKLFSGLTEESLFVTEERQWRALEEARAALGAAEQALEAAIPPELVAEHLRQALGALGKITGESFSERVLDEVFQHFCLGK